ncbi:hypothetical protein TL16_g13395 [Triparma laevis f. inornata]|uniref:Uncharacterized protein n=1 Tax=Triparma laevis f. inornata TaxID=1714386 RepID=A0A9W7F068_9STRA|nr:hypothetical protein TL16_g13395 [Triparma laevis f. inornata]
MLLEIYTVSRRSAFLSDGFGLKLAIFFFFFVVVAVIVIVIVIVHLDDVAVVHRYRNPRLSVAAGAVTAAGLPFCSVTSSGGGPRPGHHHPFHLPPASISGDFSSMGRIISTKPRSTLFKAVRIVPVQGEKLSALAVLSAPEASKFVEDYNKDVAFENKKAFQMDKVLQR